MRISPFQGFVEAAKALQKCRRLCPSGWARRRSRGLHLRHLHESSSFGAAVHRASKARTARIGIVKSRYQSTKRRPQLEGLWSSAALRCPMVWLPSARDPSRWPGLHDSPLEGDGFEPSVPRRDSVPGRDRPTMRWFGPDSPLEGDGVEARSAAECTGQPPGAFRRRVTDAAAGGSISAHQPSERSGS